MSHIDNLEFLSDVIPKTTTYKQFKEKKAKEAAAPGDLEKGQRTLNGTTPTTGEQNGDIPVGASTKPEGSSQSPTMPRTPVVPVSALMADRTVTSARHDPDVEMKD